MMFPIQGLFIFQWSWQPCGLKKPIVLSSLETQACGLFIVLKGLWKKNNRSTSTLNVCSIAFCERSWCITSKCFQIVFPMVSLSLNKALIQLC